MERPTMILLKNGCGSTSAGRSEMPSAFRTGPLSGPDLLVSVSSVRQKYRRTPLMRLTPLLFQYDVQFFTASYGRTIFEDLLLDVTV
jgi:hypothetical protein